MGVAKETSAPSSCALPAPPLTLLPRPVRPLVQTYKWAHFQERTAAKVEHIVATEKGQGPGPKGNLGQGGPGEGRGERAGTSSHHRQGSREEARANDPPDADPGRHEATGTGAAGEAEAAAEGALGQSLESRRIGIDFSKLKYRKQQVKALDSATGKQVTRTILAVDPSSIPRRNSYDHGWWANVWEVLSPRSQRVYSLSPGLERKQR